MIRWDVSYKSAKMLCRLRGKPVFKATVTGTTLLGEVRIQFDIVTDGHDQMLNAITEFKRTVEAYGQEVTEVVFTDKPKEDHGFFMKHLAGVARKENELNQNASTPFSVADKIPDCAIEDFASQCVLLSRNLMRERMAVSARENLIQITKRCI